MNDIFFLLNKQDNFWHKKIDCQNSKFTNLRYLALFQFMKYSNFPEGHFFFFDKIKPILYPQSEYSMT